MTSVDRQDAASSVEIAERDLLVAAMQERELQKRFPLLLDGLNWAQEPGRAMANLRGRLREHVYPIDAEGFEELLAFGSAKHIPEIADLVRMIAYDDQDILAPAALQALAEEGEKVAHEKLRQRQVAALATQTRDQKIAAVFGDRATAPLQRSETLIDGPEPTGR